MSTTKELIRNLEKEIYEITKEIDKIPESQELLKKINEINNLKKEANILKREILMKPGVLDNIKNRRMIKTMIRKIYMKCSHEFNLGASNIAYSGMHHGCTKCGIGLNQNPLRIKIWNRES